MIRIKKLSFAYNTRAIFTDFSVDIPAQITAVTAPSGAGKTTLLRLLLGLEQPQAGTIRFANADGSPQAAPACSVVFQENRLIESLSVLGNIRPVLPRGTETETVLQLLRALGIAEYAHTPAGKLSGGQQRRVAIARALMAEYDLLVMDEPFSGLDADRMQQTAQVILEWNRGRQLLFVTHSAADIAAMNAAELELPIAKSPAKRTAPEMQS